LAIVVGQALKPNAPERWAFAERIASVDVRVDPAAPKQYTPALAWSIARQGHFAL
jgi:hypothetical protein